MLYKSYGHEIRLNSMKRGLKAYFLFVFENDEILFISMKRGLKVFVFILYSFFINLNSMKRGLKDISAIWSCIGLEPAKLDEKRIERILTG